MINQMTLPGSKSQTQRALVLAATAASPSIIENPSPSADSRQLISMLTSLGVRFTFQQQEQKSRVEIVPPSRFAPLSALHCGDGASQARFISPIAHFLPAPLTLTGSPQLSSRSMEELVTALCACGFHVRTGTPPTLPITIDGEVSASRVAFPANTSSQHISALLLWGNRFPKGLEITLTTPPVSSAYIHMTLHLLGQFGIPYEQTETGWRLPNGVHEGAHVVIEPDLSLAPYPIIAAHLLGKPLPFTPSPHTIQEDAHFFMMWQQLCAAGTPPSFDLSGTPDLLPPLLTGAFMLGKSVTFTGTAHLRHKESDRIAILTGALAEAGATFNVTENAITLKNITPVHKPLALGSAADHRLVMALSLLTHRYEVSISQEASVEKSWPAYFEEMRRWGLLP